jgi:hypothetical protein
MGSFTIPFDRRVSKVPLGPNQFRYHVYLSSAPVPKNTIEWLRIRQAMLDSVARDIELTRHSELEWTRIEMEYKQGRWELVTTATTPNPKEAPNGQTSDETPARKK